MQLRRLFATVLLVGSTTAVIGEPESAMDVDPLTTPEGKFSYAIGYQIGTSLMRDQLAVDVEILNGAIGDAMAGLARVTPAEQMQAMQDYRQQQLDQENQKSKMNAQSGQDYLAKNRVTEGVLETDSGLQYSVIKAVTEGLSPKVEDRVTVHYRGSLIDGTEFDSSYDRGQPASFAVSKVIRGWQEGLQLMKVGEQYQFTIPAELAYGKQGPPSIGPDQVLLFEVELISID
ncbi:MAG: FKBP-type peptidyl-prolyl cis-trans isomerase [Gammaproteobacteria bacterium]|nr:FKBP-type peptidyl-prolyl cis-trans isomerase [Gammaproteobacteria bacterium]